MKLEKLTARGTENLYRHPKTGIIYFRQFKKGTGEVCKSTRTDDLAKAKDLADKFRLSLASKAEVRHPDQRATSLELFDKWLARKKTLGAASNTITSIKASRKYLEPFFKYMFPDEITAEWWEAEYIPQVKELTGNPKRKFFNDRKWLIAFLRQIKEDGILPGLPNIRKIDRPTTVGKVYSDQEIESLLNFAQNEDLHLAILMAVTMGMRRMEIFGLACDRVDLNKKVIHLRADDTKTKRARSFAISDSCWPMIKRRCSTGGKWVFPSRFDKSVHLHKDGFKTAWTNLKGIVGVKGRFHDLRHTFLTKAFKAPGINPILICHYAGLSMEVAERVYLHLTPEDTRAICSVIKFGDVT